MRKLQKEITPLSPEDLFIVLNHPDAKFDYPVHYHSDFELNLVIGSYGERVVGDSVENFSGLDLVMTGPNVPHAWFGSEEEKRHVVTLQFSDKFIHFPLLEKRLFKSIKELLYESQKGIVFARETQDKIKEKILALTKIQGFQTVLSFFSILYELSISDRRILASNQFDSQSIVRASKSRRIAKVCDYIDANYHQQIKLKDAAALVNMSESAFSHFFKKRTKCTYIDYLTSIRIAKSCQLLSETTQTVAEICYSCGFENMSNFMRIFKKKKNVTPTKYREFMEQMLIKH
ncbi:MAG: AraC family transcriptional regulator [Bacteroidales bacterium]|nr:AraC family transcriptional regulator [Bacteroidales bacterium]